jgi:predicted  nucleic acid-binding Zn-ribbon protein
VTKIAMALQASTGNAFTKVLASIDDMIAVIDKEEKTDDEKHTWCDDEQTTNESDRDTKKSDIETLESDIDDLKVDIETLETQIDNETTRLNTCHENQKTATEERQEAFAAYNKDVSNLMVASKTLKSALVTLENFYKYQHAKFAGKNATYTEMAGTGVKGGFLKAIRGASVDELKEACNNMHDCVGFDSEGNLRSEIGETFSSDGSLYTKEIPERFLQQPEFENDFAKEDGKGQNEKGNQVLDLLETILNDTRTEELEAHKAESMSQGEYDAEMESLTTEQARREKVITKKEGLKAEAEGSKLQKEEEKAKTTQEHDDIVDYLAEIKPGCTFIQENLETRKANRKSEKVALEKAIELLKDSAAFKNAEIEAHHESLGECKEICLSEDGEDHVECKACLAKVSVPAYCAGHKDTLGCDF